MGQQDLRHHEKLLQRDSRVGLTGYLEAVARDGVGAYRGGAGAPWGFEAKPEIGRVVVEELFDFPDDMGP